MTKLWKSLRNVAHYGLMCAGLGVGLYGQTPLAMKSVTFIATGSDAGVNLTSGPIDQHKILWRTQGTVTTCQVALDSSTDGVSWSAGGVIASQTCTVNGSFYAAANTGFVRISLTTLTGGGTLFVNYTGTSSLISPLDTSGIPVITGQSTKATYSSVTILTPAAAATDVFGICGSATKTVRLTLIILSGTATASTAQTFQFVKRGVADSGGTTQAMTTVPNDANNVAGTAAITAYTANPTINSTIGPVRAFAASLSPATTSITNLLYSIPFGVENDQEVVLRGANQCLYVNQNATSAAGESLTGSIQWTEE